VDFHPVDEIRPIAWIAMKLVEELQAGILRPAAVGLQNQGDSTGWPEGAERMGATEGEQGCPFFCFKLFLRREPMREASTTSSESEISASLYLQLRISNVIWRRQSLLHERLLMILLILNL